MDRVIGTNARQPSVIISKFRERHDVSGRKVAVRGLLSVYDVLSFDNDVVHNTFVDQVCLYVLFFRS